ncbi:MAG: family 20 glycosylhydrolase [Armatimonas sp.]
MRCGVTNTAGIMPWHDPKAAADAARSGNPVMMALTEHCYFDMQESRLPGELPGAGWSNPITLKRAYEWNPIPEGLTLEQQKTIMGAQGCLWTDMFLHRPDIKKLGPGSYCDYFTLPRAAALAEVVWSPQNQQNFTDFQQRLRRQLVRYSDYGWNYRLPLPEITQSGSQVSAVSPIEGGTVRYTVDGSVPTATSPELKGAITVEKFEDFKAITLALDGKRTSLVFESVDSLAEYRQYGTKLGAWKPSTVGNQKPIPVDFDATGLVSSNGTYQVTFLYTDGAERLDIDKIELFRNQETTPLAADVHHGFTGGAKKDNVYTLKVDDYQTGARFTIRAYVYGHQGNDSNGLVFIKKIP